MLFGFGILDRRRAATRRAPRSSPAATDFVVARTAEAAPSRWIFFDGVETPLASGARTLIVPGGAFFLDEACPYGTVLEAEATAARLNDASPCDERPWRAVAVETVRLGRRLL